MDIQYFREYLEERVMLWKSNWWFVLTLSIKNENYTKLGYETASTSGGGKVGAHNRSFVSGFNGHVGRRWWQISEAIRWIFLVYKPSPSPPLTSLHFVSKLFWDCIFLLDLGESFIHKLSFSNLTHFYYNNLSLS